jgi:hypothetical protein
LREALLNVSPRLIENGQSLGLGHPPLGQQHTSFDWFSILKGTITEKNMGQLPFCLLIAG